MAQVEDLNYRREGDNRAYRYYSTDLILKYIAKESHVLDVGAGDGAVALPVASQTGSSVVCFDQAEERLEYLESIKGNLPITTKCGDCHKLPFLDAEFDCVYSRMLLAILPTWRDALAEQVRVCKPGGYVIAHHRSADIVDFVAKSVPASERRDDLLRRRRRSNRSLATKEQFASAAKEMGLEIEKIVPLGFFLSNSLIFESIFSPDEYAEFKSAYLEKLEDPAVYNFIDWFDKIVTSRMPNALTEMFIVVMKKFG